MVGNCFLVLYLKIFRAKDGLPLEIDGEKESCGAEIYRWLARTWAIE